MRRVLSASRQVAGACRHRVTRGRATHRLRRENLFPFHVGVEPATVRVLTEPDCCRINLRVPCEYRLFCAARDINTFVVRIIAECTHAVSATCRFRFVFSAAWFCFPCHVRAYVTLDFLLLSSPSSYLTYFSLMNRFLRRGVAVTSLGVSTKLLHIGPVTTGMGDRLRRTNHLSISPSHPGQLSLQPSAGREMGTRQSAVMLCGWGVKAGMVHSHLWLNVWVAGKTV